MPPIMPDDDKYDAVLAKRYVTLRNPLGVTDYLKWMLFGTDCIPQWLQPTVLSLGYSVLPLEMTYSSKPVDSFFRKKTTVPNTWLAQWTAGPPSRPTLKGCQNQFRMRLCIARMDECLREYNLVNAPVEFPVNTDTTLKFDHQLVPKIFANFYPRNAETKEKGMPCNDDLPPLERDTDDLHQSAITIKTTINMTTNAIVVPSKTIISSPAAEFARSSRTETPNTARNLLEGKGESSEKKSNFNLTSLSSRPPITAVTLPRRKIPRIVRVTTTESTTTTNTLQLAQQPQAKQPSQRQQHRPKSQKPPTPNQEQRHRPYESSLDAELILPIDDYPANLNNSNHSNNSIPSRSYSPYRNQRISPSRSRSRSRSRERRQVPLIVHPAEPSPGRLGQYHNRSKSRSRSPPSRSNLRKSSSMHVIPNPPVVAAVPAPAPLRFVKQQPKIIPPQNPADHEAALKAAPWNIQRAENDRLVAERQASNAETLYNCSPALAAAFQKHVGSFHSLIF